MRALLLSFSLLIPAVFAAPDVSNQFAELRAILLIDTSSSMAPFRQAITNRTYQLIHSGFQGALQPGDKFAIWPFTDTPLIYRFPPRDWSPEKANDLATFAMWFAATQLFDGRGRMSPTTEQVLATMGQSSHLTIVMLTDGETPISGTAFDAPINAAVQRIRRSTARLREPLSIVLLGAGGYYLDWAITEHSGPLRIPTLRLDRATSNPPAQLPPSTQERSPAPEPPPPSLFAQDVAVRPTVSQPSLANNSRAGREETTASDSESVPKASSAADSEPAALEPALPLPEPNPAATQQTEKPVIASSLPEVRLPEPESQHSPRSSPSPQDFTTQSPPVQISQANSAEPASAAIAPREPASKENYKENAGPRLNTTAAAETPPPSRADPSPIEDRPALDQPPQISDTTSEAEKPEPKVIPWTIATIGSIAGVGAAILLILLLLWKKRTPEPSLISKYYDARRR